VQFLCSFLLDLARALAHPGSGLYTTSQLRAATAELEANVFGNPHSTNPSSALAWAEVDAARARVLAYFNADPGEYAVVFTRYAGWPAAERSPRRGLRKRKSAVARAARALLACLLARARGGRSSFGAHAKP
jgi:hypothetical protein